MTRLLFSPTLAPETCPHLSSRTFYHTSRKTSQGHRLLEVPHLSWDPYSVEKERRDPQEQPLMMVAHLVGEGKRETAPKCRQRAKPPPASSSRVLMCHLRLSCAAECPPPTQMGPHRVPVCCQERSPSPGMPAERAYQSPSELRGFPSEWNFTAWWPISKSCTLMGS